MHVNNFLWALINTAITMAVPLLILPIQVRLLTQNELGWWSIWVSLVGLIGILTSSVNLTILRFASYSNSEMVGEATVSRGLNRLTLWNASLSIGFRLACVVVLIASIVGACYAFLSEYFFLDRVIIPWIILIFSVGFLSVSNILPSFLQGVGGQASSFKYLLFSRVGQVVTVIGALYFNLKLFSYPLSILVFSCLCVYFHGKSKEISAVRGAGPNENHEGMRNLRKSLVKPIVYQVVSASGGWLNSVSHVIIIGLYLGPTYAAMYGISLQIAHFFTSISIIPVSIILPGLGGDFIAKKFYAFRRKARYAVLYSSVMFIGLSAIFMICGLSMTELYLNNFRFISRGQFILLLFIVYSEFISRSVCGQILFAANDARHSMPFFISGVISAFLCCIILKFTNLGIWGGIIAQISVQMSYNSWKWPLQLIRLLDPKSMELECRSGLVQKQYAH